MPPLETVPAVPGIPPARNTTSVGRILAVLLAVVLAVLSLPAASNAQGAAVLTVTYPTADGPAAAQVGEVIDVDVATSAAGSLAAAIRPTGSGAWRPVDLATLEDEPPVGDTVATLEVPAGADAGAHDLRIELLDGGGAVLDTEVIASGLVVEEYGLTTGFEDRDGASWTTHEEELGYLDDVEAASDRVAMDHIGDTVQGRPMHLVRVAVPGPPDVVDLDDARTMLFVCTQHGNEPAPREACLRELRRLAFTDDARTVEYLRDTTVLFIPTANPDGRELNIRANAEGFDLNRDHLRLATPEGRIMARAIRDVRPHVFADFHEFGGGASRPAFEYIWARHLNVDADLRELAVEWGNDWLSPRLDANGFTNRIYQANPGTGENVTILNAAALRHSVGVLTESRRDALPGEETLAQTQRRRVATQDLAARETLRFHQRNADRIEATIAASIARKTAAGIHRDGPYFWFGNSEDLPQLPPDEAILDHPPCGYLLTRAQAQTVAPWIEAYGISTVDIGNRVYVPMGQEDQPTIGLKLDDRGTSNDVSGTPWPRPDAEGRPDRPDLPCATDRLGFDPR